MSARYFIDTEYDLDIPAQGALESITVAVDIVPFDGEVIIFGWSRDGRIAKVDVKGSQPSVRLPFVHARIAIKRVGKVSMCRLMDTRWRSGKGAEFVPPVRSISDALVSEYGRSPIAQWHALRVRHPVSNLRAGALLLSVQF